MVKLMIVEDNDVVRSGLVKFFSDQDGITIVAEAASGMTALSLLNDETGVDVVLVDWNMPDMDGLKLTSIIAGSFPEVKVIILTMHSKPEYKTKAIAAGAKGYILKDGEFEELVTAVFTVANGHTVF